MPALRRLPAALAALGGCAVLAGCSSAAVSSGGSRGAADLAVSAASSAPASQGLDGPAHLAPGGAGAPVATAQGTATLDIGQPQGRIERRVDASFRVDHGGFQTAFDAVVERATSLGGFVVESDTQPDDSGRVASGSVTVRVPAGKLSSFVGGFGTTLRLSSLDYSSIDHTSESVDLAARLSAAKGHRDALEQLLGKAQSIQDITGLEEQIAEVQAQIDQLQGQLDAVAGAVELATAKIGITEDGLAAPPPPPSPSPLLDALRSGWSNATSVVSALVVGAVSILPVLALVALLAVAARWWRRLLPAASPRPAGVPAAPRDAGD